MGVKYEEYEIPKSILEGNANAKRIESRFNKLLSVEKYQESYKIAKCDVITRMSYNEQILKYCRDGILILDVLIAEVNQVLMQAGISAITPVDVELFKFNHIFNSFHQDVAFLTVSVTALQAIDIKLGEKQYRLPCSDEVTNKSEPLSPAQLASIKQVQRDRHEEQAIIRTMQSNNPKAFMWWQRALSNSCQLEDFIGSVGVYSITDIYQKYCSLIEMIQENQTVELKTIQEVNGIVKGFTSGEIPAYRNDLHLLSTLCSFEGLL